MDFHVYLQLFMTQKAKVGQTLLLSNIARLEGEADLLRELGPVPVYTVQPEDHTHVVIDVLTVLQKIHERFPDMDIDIIGPNQTVIEIEMPRKKTTPIVLCLVWILLFTGAALAIMNFHEDVSMLAVHQKLHLLITGKEDEQPLFIQIPYSFGLGIGMILFFNHIFKRRINEEPSPLEIEVHQYNQEINKYLSENESDRSSKPWSSKSKSCSPS